MNKKHVIILGGGFAGMSCAHKLIGNKDIHVTLIDQNNYHKFTPLLYQVAVAAFPSAAAAIPFRRYFSGKTNIDVKMATAASVNPNTLTVQTEEGETYKGDYLVLATGSIVNFFSTPGADTYSLPLYNLVDAERLRSRLIGCFEDADRNQLLIDQGVLNFVIVGAGPTGTEIAGAIADMLHFSLPQEFNDLALKKTKIYLVNHGPTVLGAFTRESQSYTEKVLKERGVDLVMGIHVDKVTDSCVELSNGEKILTKTVIWAGGLRASPLADKCGLQQGHAGRVIICSDLTVKGFPNIYALGDIAIIPGADGKPLPQLASVAKQMGEWAAKNILAQVKGKAPSPFQYKDKGIMAMIGKNAAIVEIGKQRRELKGFFAYFAWLGVHIALLSTLFQKIQAFIGWILNYAGKTVSQILDGSDNMRIKWDDGEKKES